MSDLLLAPPEGGAPAEFPTAGKKLAQRAHLHLEGLRHQCDRIVHQRLEVVVGEGSKRQVGEQGLPARSRLERLACLLALG